MKWTKTKPSEAGLYWWRESKKDRPTICDIDKCGFAAFFGLEDNPGDSVKTMKGEWAGPIQEPEEEIGNQLTETT